MKKQQLIALLNAQQQLTKKTTRKDIISFIADMVEYHIKDNADIKGVNPTRDNLGVNLGEVMEVIAKSLFRNKLEKSDSSKHYDLVAKGEKVEVKFSTSDAYAHPINQNEKVDYYLLITYSKKLGLNAFKVPYDKRNEIDTNNQNRITINQKVKFLDRDLTERLSPRA
jgi:hypothetical protein